MAGVLLVGPGGPPDPGSTAVVSAAAAALAPWRPTTSLAAGLRPGNPVVVVGGAPFTSPGGGLPGSELRRLRRLVAGSRLTRGCLILVGVGAAPLSGRAARTAARVAAVADLLVLRDRPSAAHLVAAGAVPPLRVGADPTWLLVDPDGSADEAGHRAGILVVPGSEPTGPALLAERLNRLGHRARLVPWGPAHPTPAEGIEWSPRPSGLEAARDLFSRGELVVSFRFHGMVAAAAAGAPCIGIGPDPGLAALADRLGQPWVPAPQLEAALATTVTGALEAGPAAPANVKDEVVRADEGLRLVRLLLSGGDAEEAETLVGVPLEPSPWA